MCLGAVIKNDFKKKSTNSSEQSCEFNLKGFLYVLVGKENIA